MMTGGVSTQLACSNAAVVPWRGATYAGAVAACAAAGKVLCTGDQWVTACQGATPTPPPVNPLLFPYGAAFDANTCNTETYDGDPIAAGNQNVATLTGALASCKSTAAGTIGVFDLSGNLKEWTDEDTGNANIKIQRGGSYQSPSTSSTCQFKLTRSAVGAIEQETGFRCCRLTAP
jgi:formylglycine-generating enzyme required for sulfatase activity